MAGQATAEIATHVSISKKTHAVDWKMLVVSICTIVLCFHMVQEKNTCE